MENRAKDARYHRVSLWWLAFVPSSRLYILWTLKNKHLLCRACRGWWLVVSNTFRTAFIVWPIHQDSQTCRSRLWVYRVPSFSTTGILDQTTLYFGGCSVHYRMFSGIPTHEILIKSHCRLWWLKMSSDITRCLPSPTSRAEHPKLGPSRLEHERGSRHLGELMVTECLQWIYNVGMPVHPLTRIGC